MNPARLALACALAALTQCDSAGPRPDASGANVAIRVAPLSLPGVSDASYRLTVKNSGGEVVWTRDVTSTAYGAGDGGLSYVGPCDAEATPNTVGLELLSLDAGGAPLTAGTDYMNPAPEGSPIVKTQIGCDSNADTPVDFDLVVMRRATQGFFDVAVAFSDVFCSAKLDCKDGADDIKLLFDPLTGARETTAVLAFACTSGVDSDTTLLMDDVIVTCTGGQSPTAVDVTAGPGNLSPAFPGPAPNTTDLYFQTAVFRGAEQLGTYMKAYWNVALGLNRDAFAGLGTCTLTTRATAVDGPSAQPGATPDGAVYPIVSWDLPIVSGGALTCTHHGLDDPDGLVATGYTTTAGATFGNVFRRQTGEAANVVAGTCTSDLQCPSGSFCDVADLDHDGNATECLPQQASSLPCTTGRDQECQPGLACVDGSCCGAGDCALQPGTGGDGALSVTSGTFNAATSGSNGRTTPDMEAHRVVDATDAALTVDAGTGFAPDDLVLAIVLGGPQGAVAPVGSWELHRVVSAGGTDVTLDSGLGFGFASADYAAYTVFVQRVPQYASVDVAAGASLTTTGFPSGGTGVIALKSAGAVTIAGSVSADDRGWVGIGPASNGTHGSAGDSLAAHPLPASAPGQANYGGGGGGVSDCNVYACSSQQIGAGGGGGGYGTVGTVGANNGSLQTGGDGGGTYGDACLSGLYLGSGGGGGAGGYSGPGTSTPGGNGGGLIFISAPQITVTGSVLARGEKGSTNNNCGSHGGGGGGGGSGGTILLAASQLDVSGGALLATGATARCNGGGTGGSGRVQLRFDTLNGAGIGTAGATSALSTVASPAAACPVSITP